MTTLIEMSLYLFVVLNYELYIYWNTKIRLHLYVKILKKAESTFKDHKKNSVFTIFPNALYLLFLTIKRCFSVSSQLPRVPVSSLGSGFRVCLERGWEALFCGWLACLVVTIGTFSASFLDTHLPLELIVLLCAPMTLVYQFSVRAFCQSDLWTCFSCLMYQAL